MKVSTRKDQIVKTAAKLFKEKGYSAVTMRDLASEMGIKAASLYNHINSKQDILNTIIMSLAEEFTAEMKIISTSKESSINKLKQIIAVHVRISSQNSYGMAALNNDWMHLEAQIDYYKKLRNNYENDFKTILTDGIKAGEIVDAKPEIMMFSILTTLRSLYIWIPKKEEIKINELTQHLTDILIKGIVK